MSIYDFVGSTWPAGEGGVIVGTGNDRGPCMYAALANGVSAHAIEMDDVNNEPSLHPSAVIYPAALAMAERSGATGRALMEAVVTGYEVMVRIGTALRPEQTYRRGFHPTGVCGVSLPRRATGRGGENTGVVRHNHAVRIGNRGQPGRGLHGIPGPGGVDQAVSSRLGRPQRDTGRAPSPAAGSWVREPSWRGGTDSFMPTPKGAT